MVDECWHYALIELVELVEEEEKEIYIKKEAEEKEEEEKEEYGFDIDMEEKKQFKVMGRIVGYKPFLIGIIESATKHTVSISYDENTHHVWGVLDGKTIRYIHEHETIVAREAPFLGKRTIEGIKNDVIHPPNINPEVAKLNENEYIEHIRKTQASNRAGVDEIQDYHFALGTYDSHHLGSGKNFKGQLYRFRVWNEARGYEDDEIINRSPTKYETIVAPPLRKSNLLLHYELTSFTSKMIQDKSQHRRHGTFKGPVSQKSNYATIDQKIQNKEQEAYLKTFHEAMKAYKNEKYDSAGEALREFIKLPLADSPLVTYYSQLFICMCDVKRFEKNRQMATDEEAQQQLRAEKSTFYANKLKTYQLVNLSAYCHNTKPYQKYALYAYAYIMFQHSQQTNKAKNERIVKACREAIALDNDYIAPHQLLIEYYSFHGFPNRAAYAKSWVDKLLNRQQQQDIKKESLHTQQQEELPKSFGMVDSIINFNW
eukprot:CAMPEP_0117420692 /NCGR_PEP_ID=MMETSP0758-20121206/1965_1 /TAXON_ID=63605 /ORGANISM="Percolomonas cosmopolitus, Strain AE-1 (ATCC 50343)" /LENGTH=484 /DNA_ID=CAMNT_0005202433 /DNA_START=278 /DNA_END=1729 /DNA_ORIENTATION=+